MKKARVSILRLGVHSAILLEVRTRSVQSNAAVDDQLRAGDVARILRQQESGCPGHFVGCAPTVSRATLQQSFLQTPLAGQQEGPFSLSSVCRSARGLTHSPAYRAGLTRRPGSYRGK